jgi:AMP-binding enzyme/Phosphopantetheine attachment site
VPTTRSLETTALRLARGRASETALLTGDWALDYGDLRDRIDARRSELGPTRRLVMIAGANEVEPIVTYLAALEGGHPVLFIDGDLTRHGGVEHRDGLIERFEPDVVAADDGGWELVERRAGTRHELHPDLALLASTSGSTGSPKLVRLSHDNLLSNAVAIGDYLNLGEDDRAATTLPLHYCYGLSVVNSHLVAGGSLLLSSRSVVEDPFWAEFEATGSTSFAGVPYTFDLLEASGFEGRAIRSLRYVTQAGGRLHPDRVRHFAALGRERGFELFVMYGQTEATARMAYLPSRLAETAAGAIGIPIPGGRFRIDDPSAEGVGELVYDGPNVMMGYATEPADFAAGRTVDELRTGDLARRRPDGLFEIVGRANRFVKVFGLRIDLDRVERLFDEDGVPVRAASSDERLLLFVTADRLVDRTRERAMAITGLPAHAVRVYAIAEFPRTASGKPDTAALVRYAAQLEAAQADVSHGDGVTPETIRALFAELLGRPDTEADDSFAGLGGDSLSYVEVSLRLEELLGPLPREWPSMSARELAELGAPAASGAFEGPAADASMAASAQAAPTVERTVRTRRWMPRVETPAVLRALAIVLIVGTHANLFDLKGGAHLLLAVAGYNLARFQLADVTGRSRSLGILKSTAQVVVPAVIWIGAVALITGGYRPATVLLVNNFGGDAAWSVHWQFWFIEAVIWTMLALAAAFAIPHVDRLERRHPFGFALGLLGAALAARVVFLGGVEAHATERYTTLLVVWCIALGWLVARSGTLRQRLLTSAVACIAVPGFFGTPSREAIVLIGILVLLWFPTLPVVRPLVPVVGVLAGASMFVYLTHWQVYPPLEDHVPWLAMLLSLAIGVAVWKSYTVVVARVGRSLRRRASAGVRA